MRINDRSKSDFDRAKIKLTGHFDRRPTGRYFEPCKYPHASFVCKLQVRFFLSCRFQSFQSLFGSLFLLVSITKFNWLQNTGAQLFCIWNFLSAAFFGFRESPSRALWLIFRFVSEHCLYAVHYVYFIIWRKNKSIFFPQRVQQFSHASPTNNLFSKQS